MDNSTKVLLAVAGAIVGTLFVAIMVTIVVVVSVQEPPADPVPTTAPVNWQDPAAGPDPDVYRLPRLRPDQCPGPNCP